MAKKLIQKGIIHLLCGKRNIHGTLTNLEGKPRVTVSCGTIKLRGGRQNNPLFARYLGTNLGVQCKKHGFLRVHLRCRGKGRQLRGFVKGLRKVKGVKLLSLTRVIRKPHNGCRPRKQRRR